MKPTATYRVQLNSEFSFDCLKAILPYLSQLGISHVYASPIAQARRGSKHGYDTLDHTRINEALGGQDAFESCIKEAHARGLGWLQDIVPNHIAYSPESTIISDLMNRGEHSAFKSFLDIDWNHPSVRLRGRLLAPFLKADLREALQKGEIGLAWHSGLKVMYGEMEFPVQVGSYSDVLPETTRTLLSTETEAAFNRAILDTYTSDKKARDAVNREIEWVNRDVDLLEGLLSRQVYVLENWKTAYRQINYRRFFDILDLICLCQEREDVFAGTHRLVQKLVSEGEVDGLRVDHIDGLSNPKEYLGRLRKMAPQAFIIVEKILLGDETLPSMWSVDGTTGYDFLNQLNSLFVASQNEGEITHVYREFTGDDEALDDVLYECKKSVICTLFRGDAENLARMLCQAMKTIREEVFTKHLAFEIVVEVLSAFPVYRTYVSPEGMSSSDRRLLKSALETAKERNGKLKSELSAIEEMLEQSPLPEDTLAWLGRLQQYTGAIMAKALEDTAFYIFNRLLSLNEVGGNPAQFGCSTENFHGFIKSRQTSYPTSLNASSTHDTKRGEDARARINVLSEIPSEFNLQIKKWAMINKQKKIKIHGKYAPNRKEEYYIYQTLIGSLPFENDEMPTFAARLKEHIVKAAREAKVNSNWLKPNQLYEEALASFATQLIDASGGGHFLDEFLPFQKKISFFGFLNSLSQTLLKITCPGTPDFYQGSELWNLSMVDPDNRQPVDFAVRLKMLKELLKLKPTKIPMLLDNFADGKAKLYVVNRALKTRSDKREIFQKGNYVPLKAKGAFSDHVIAFSRMKAQNHALAIAPRFVATLTKGEEYLPLGEVWRDTTVSLPHGAPTRWVDVFTGEQIYSEKIGEGRRLHVAEVLSRFPVALLLPDEGNT